MGLIVVFQIVCFQFLIGFMTLIHCQILNLLSFSLKQNLNIDEKIIEKLKLKIGIYQNVKIFGYLSGA